MRKITIVPIVLILFLLVGIVSPKISEIKNKQSEKTIIYEKYLPIEEALREISSREYDLKNYNCVNYCHDLQDELRKSGIESILIYGKTPKCGGHESHCWVAIEFEPYFGKTISASMGYRPTIASWDYPAVEESEIESLMNDINNYKN